MGEGMIFNFFDCSSPFCFLTVEFHWTFFISSKIQKKWLLLYFDYVVFRSFFLITFFVSAILFSILTSFFLPSSVSLPYFILAVPMRECLRKHSCMSSAFPIVILNGTCFLPTVQLLVHNVYSERKTGKS